MRAPGPLEEPNEQRTATTSPFGTYVSRADGEFAAQIEDAPAPFWRHVRDALAEPHP